MDKKKKVFLQYTPITLDIDTQGERMDKDKAKIIIEALKLLEGLKKKLHEILNGLK